MSGSIEAPVIRKLLAMDQSKLETDEGYAALSKLTDAKTRERNATVSYKTVAEALVSAIANGADQRELIASMMNAHDECVAATNAVTAAEAELIALMDAVTNDKVVD